MRFFEETLEETLASVTSEMEKEYDEIAKKLKQEAPDRRDQIGFTPSQDDE